MSIESPSLQGISTCVITRYLLVAGGENIQILLLLAYCAKYQ